MTLSDRKRQAKTIKYTRWKLRLLMIRRGLEVLRDDGVGTLVRRTVRYVYENGLREKLPRQQVDYNGVTTRAGRWLDPVIPGHSLHKPKYEEAIVSALQEHVRRDDNVVVVGGGWGVSATVAAERAGPSGHVCVYEGAEASVNHVHETAALNGYEDRITVDHAIIGREVSLLSDAGDAQVRPGSDLPACNVLVLDCEGAELDILDSMTIEPSVIIVETHEFLGSSVNAVRERLRDLGYAIRRCSVAESTDTAYCEENGIYVLVAVPS